MLTMSRKIQCHLDSPYESPYPVSKDMAVLLIIVLFVGYVIYEALS